jgi:hypothetical protein
MGYNRCFKRERFRVWNKGYINRIEREGGEDEEANCE